MGINLINYIYSVALKICLSSVNIYKTLSGVVTI